MREQPYDGLSLFGHSGNRKYLNADERRRFLESTQQLPPPERLFCQVLALSGGRISEVLALTPAAIDIESGVANIETLKRRRRGFVRQVPLPPDSLTNLDRFFCLGAAQRDPKRAAERIWRFSRTTAWRYVKAVMASAGITGTPAMPKGLRHAFGVKAFQSNVPPHLVQRWLGHASLKTTSIYGAALSPRLLRKRNRSSAATLTALTISKKTHQIATGFDQSSHAMLIGLPPRALPNAHESVIRLTYKARSSQTFGPPRPAVHRGKAPGELSGAAGHSNVPGFMSRMMQAALDLRVLNAIFLESPVVPMLSVGARGVFDGRCRQFPQPRRIAQKAAPAIPLYCQRSA